MHIDLGHENHKPLSCPFIMPKKQKIKIEHTYQNTPNKQ